MRLFLEMRALVHALSADHARLLKTSCCASGSTFYGAATTSRGAICRWMGDAPEPRQLEHAAKPILGGLHHTRALREQACKHSGRGSRYQCALIATDPPLTPRRLLNDHIEANTPVTFTRYRRLFW